MTATSADSAERTLAPVLVARVSTSDQTLVLAPSTAYWRLLHWEQDVLLSSFDFLLPRRRNASAGGMASGSGALAYFEERHAALGSAYEDLHWPLSAVIKWIAGRTPEAVDN